RVPGQPRDGKRGVGRATRTRTACVRRATGGDVGRIALLLGELGYPAPAEAVARRLERLLASPAAAFVAGEGGEVLAFCPAHLFDGIQEDRPLVRLSVLVVSARARRRGLGRALMDEAERWALAAGAGRVVIASGLARADAHAFYEALGYVHNARRYVKRL